MRQDVRQNGQYQGSRFGHWSTLGLLLRKNVIALDTGCLWGGTMSAIRLDDRQLFQTTCNNPVAKHW